MFKHDNKPERIICAAIWLKGNYNPPNQIKNIDSGLVLCGHRHGHIISQINILTGKRMSEHDYVQGFLTSHNRFLDRVEAHKLFSIYDKPEYSNELYSEDLY